MYLSTLSILKQIYHYLNQQQYSKILLKESDNILNKKAQFISNDHQKNQHMTLKTNKYKLQQLGIKLMKSGDKLGRKQPKTQSCSIDDSRQFQKFKDEHFSNQQAPKIQSRRTKTKNIKSLSVYALVNQPYYNTITNLAQPQIVRENHLHSMNQSNLEQEVSSGRLKRKNKEHSSSQIESTRMLRYVGNDASQQKDMILTQQQKDVLKSSEKINLIKRILNVYHSKSIQRAYYSNLMNNLNNKTHTETDNNVKNKNVTIKKMAKNSLRQNFSRTAKNQQILKIGQLYNMHGFDITQQYSKHHSITLQAQGMNDLIKDFLQKKRLSRTQKSPQLGSKKRQKCTTVLQSQIRTLKQSRHIRKNKSKFQSINEIKTKMLHNMSDNSLFYKINKYRQFLFILNFSSSIYRQLDILKYQQPYKIYIGKGNNSNLIKSLIKKRFWFESTKNKEEANFVWTQLKEQAIYMKQQFSKNGVSISNYDILGQSSIKQYLKDTQETNKTSIDLLNDNSETHHKNIEDNLKQTKQTKKQPKYRIKKSQLNQSQLKILTDKQNDNYSQVLSEFILKKKYKFSDRIKFLKNIKIQLNHQQSNHLIHNHLTLNGLLGNKKAMFYMVRQYYNLMNKNVFEIIPLTYHIKKGFLDDEYKRFFHKYQQISKNNRDGKSYWIIKPGQFSNRGQGITCTSKLQQVRARISSTKKMGKNKSLILQKYITNPLLYNGRKFDIRAYMLITINNGKLRGYWYQDGYIRTSSSIWSLQNITDTLIHLTNDAIQKYSQNYGKYEPGNKLTYSQLQRYLDNLPKNGKNYNFMNSIYPKMKEVAMDAIKSTYCFIDPQRAGNNFEIFGLDFMIDTDFKPWLIEINTNPCLEMSCPVLERIIPSMVQNVLRISVDTVFPPPSNFSSTYKYSIPQNALYYNKFQLIFDEDRDGKSLRELYKHSRVMQQIDQYEEDKQQYEQEGEQLVLIQN